jgi:MFS family permease
MQALTSKAVRREYMKFGLLTADFSISRRNFVAVTLLSSGTLAWFFVVFAYFQDIFTLSVKVDMFWINIGEAVFVTFAVLSVIIGSMIAEKINVRKLLWSWIALGLLATASLAVFQGIYFALFDSALLGVSFGLGFPCCLGFLSHYAAAEERGRVAGAIFFEAFAFVVLAFLVAEQSLISSGIAGVIIIIMCVGLRSISILALVLIPFQREQGKARSWGSIFGNRNLVLYLIPWIMFNIASGLVSFVQNWIYQQPNSTDYDWAFTIGNAIHFLMPVIFALISGVVADRFGRKQPIVFGMIMLGISFVLLGSFTSPLSLFIYLTISGAAWGFLIVVYATVPSDLAYGGSQEKFYALCTILPLIVNLSITRIANFSGASMAVTLSSILSIIIFVSIIPVLRATETLPESTIREKEAREHIKKVEKLVEESRKKA